MYTEEITLEKLDIIRERTGAGYEEAKIALEQVNGNIIEAIISLEKQEKTASKEMFGTINEIINPINDIIKKGTATKIKIKNGDTEILEIPLVAGLVGAGIGYTLSKPIFLAVSGLTAIGAITNKITIEITNADGSVEVLNKMLEDTTNSVKEKIDEATKNVKDNMDKTYKNIKYKVDDVTNGIKGTKPEEESYSVSFEEDEEDENENENENENEEETKINSKVKDIKEKKDKKYKK